MRSGVLSSNVYVKIIGAFSSWYMPLIVLTVTSRERVLTLYVLLVGETIVINGPAGGMYTFAFAKRLNCVPATAENNNASASVSAAVFLFMSSCLPFVSWNIPVDRHLLLLLLQ